MNCVTRNFSISRRFISECLNEPFRRHIAGRGLVPLLGLGEALTALDAAAHVGGQVLPARGRADIVCKVQKQGLEVTVDGVQVATWNGREEDCETSIPRETRLSSARYQECSSDPPSSPSVHLG